MVDPTSISGAGICSGKTWINSCGRLFMTGYFGEGDGYCLRYLFSDSLRFKIMSFSLLSFRIWGSGRSFAVNRVKIKDIHNNSKVGFDFFNIACPKPNQLLTRVYCQFQENSRTKWMILYMVSTPT